MKKRLPIYTIYDKVCMKRTLLAMALLLSTAGWGQNYTFRYVNNADGKGAFGNDGASWETAKSNLQNAIDDAFEELQQEGNENMLGYIYVAGAEPEGISPGQLYVPTRRSTDDADGTLFNTSFRIYERIYVFGGFQGTEGPATEGYTTQQELPGLRIMTNGQTYAENERTIKNSRNVADQAVRRWNFKYKTILSGNHSLTTPSFKYDAEHGRYTTNFPLSSYHVVWFATNGRVGTTGHFLPLNAEACVDGCTISEGNASGTDYTHHGHIGYGGGAYMVKNALLRNCTVERCAAAIRGGGVYMDGGGEVERCYVHTCQTLGVGVSQGYGGAVCIDYDGSVQHSYIIQSSARIGAGLAICHVPSEYPFAQVGDGTQVSSYSPYATATVISNCTSTAEGGGVYLDEGGTLNHCTVVNNTCVGPDVFYYGRRHGRTGGIYVNTRGTIYNTVAWGNTSPVNNDVQFASFRSDKAAAEDVIAVYHSAFSNHDISDWANATKESVFSLNKDNTPEDADASGNYPIFRQPTAEAGIISDDDGTVHVDANGAGEAYQRVYNWHPRAASSLRMKAVQVNSAIQGITDYVLHAHTTVDVIGRQYEPISCIGALAQNYRTITHVLVPSQERGENDLIPTLFVDPSPKIYGSTNSANSLGYLDDEETGDSWEHPSGNLANAINHFRQFQVTDRHDSHFLEYKIDGTYYKHVQILVKEGTLTTAGIGAYLGAQARTAAVRPTSGMRLYGGFASSKTGTDTGDRNQRKTPTRITANVLSSTYMNNGAHVFALSNVRDVVIDGFRLYSGNANLSTDISYSDEPIQFGGGIIVNNATAAAADRIDMTGNIIRNCVFSNCSAPEGAAVYVNGSYTNPETGRNCKAELTVINCIMRNSTAGDMHGDHEYYMEEKGHTTDAGVVTANGNAHIWLRNCDIVNNCGYGLKATNRPAYGDRYQVEIYNSIIFSNGRTINTDRTNIHNPVSCLWNDERTIIGNYLYTDYDVNKPDGLPADIKFFNILTRMKADDMKDNPNWAEDDPEELKKLRYPYFINPSRNVGHSEDTDKPLYGGVVNYEPMNMNPIVNGAKPLDKTFDDWVASDDLLTAQGDDTYNLNCKTIAYDSGFFTRDYGGDPDAGAIENTRLPAAGAVLYVTPNGSGRMDGSSWANAIAGNTVYKVGGTFVVDEKGDTIRTSNRLYRGGFAEDYIYRNAESNYIEDLTMTENLYFDEGDNPVRTSTSTVHTDFTIKHKADLGKVPTEYIYGEKSGASRAFYRTNLKEGKLAEAYQVDGTAGYRGMKTITNPTTSDINITNNREEDYVSGLQFAVEKASAYNTSDSKIEGVDSIQVWVGNGVYTDFKGYVMRDRVSVYGGFPASTVNAPGMSERHALMSDSIPLSEVNKELEGQKARYETILQVQDKKPYLDDWSFNEAVLYQDNEHPDRKFQDKDLVSGFTRKTTSTSITLNKRYRKLGTAVSVDVISNPAFNSNTNDWTLTRSDTKDTKYHNTKDTYEVEGQEGISFEKFMELRKNVTTGSTDLANLKCYCTISSLPIGYYHFEADVIAAKRSAEDANLADETTRADNVYLFWTTDLNNIPEENRLKVSTKNKTARHFVLNNVKLSQMQTVYFGLTVVDEGAQKANYVCIDNVKLFQENCDAVLDVAGVGEIDYTTAKLKNPSFTTRNYEGWTLSDNLTLNSYTTGTTNKNVYGVQINNATKCMLYQDIENLEKGLYRVSCDGFNAMGGKVALFANGVENQLQVVYDEDKDLSLANSIDRMVTGAYRNSVYVYVGEAGHLRVGLKEESGANKRCRFSNFQLTKLNIEGDNPLQLSTSTTGGDLTETKEKLYTTIRKPVLFMPDVCMTTFFPGTIDGNDNPSNENRSNRDKGIYTPKNANGYVAYKNVQWDGFTIRNGFYYDYYANRDGGAGVRMFEGGTLENCVVVDNANMGASRSRGGGGYCDGRSSKVISCFFVSNLDSGIRPGNNDKDTMGGGIFLLVGTCYNSLFANNVCLGVDSRGAGIYIEQATFYNNTIAYNKCYLRDKKSVNKSKGNAVHQYEGAQNGGSLNVYNTIIYGNTGPAIGSEDPKKLNQFKNCYIQSASLLTSKGSTNDTKSPLTNPISLEQRQDIFKDCILADGYDASVIADNPFEKGDEAEALNNFRLKSTSFCINRGLIPEDQVATFPDKDVDFADRVQDCQVDIGAYEYDGTKDIEPDLTHDGEAIFYVSQNGGGVANSGSPENAGCMNKLQKILDAAGRWKYAASYYGLTNTDGKYVDNNFTREVLESELTAAGVPDSALASKLAGLKDRTVIVKLAGDYTETKTGFSYEPTRSTSTQYTSSEENVLEYSFIIPHGVQVKGGYRADEVDKDDGTGDKWPAFAEETRDIIGNPTRLSGHIYNRTNDTNGQVFHVVTFTNDLFDTNERLFENGSLGYKTDLLKVYTDEKDRAVVDGVFIQDGAASGTATDERRGGAGVVTGFAHVSNSVIQNNSAIENGGGLYLEPAALVSGCIVKNNSADFGGGLYVEQPSEVTSKTWVHIFNTTVVANTATTRAGGLFFQSNLRANSSAFWKNTANDLNNVAGSFTSSGTSSQAEETYPFIYCGVESRRIAGVNNVELPPEELNGMRWDHTARYEEGADKEIVYYPITMSSVLARAGMTYAAYADLRTVYPTLSTTDIMGLNWMAETEGGTTGSGIVKKLKDNAFIEMGARVLNETFKISIDPDHVMRRLFVTTTDLLPSADAKALQDQDDRPIYKQMGSTFANPFHRLGDAFEYIMEVRKSAAVPTGESSTLGELYRNQRFEVFVTRGTYYPFRDAYGQQGNARTNTFVIPEGVTLIGGVDNTQSRGHWYCQEGFDADAEAIDINVGGITLNAAKTQDIRDDRDHTDKNGNFVMEPWELTNQTILSGNAVNQGEKTNVYHVVTCLADEGQVGKLPVRYSDEALTSELPALSGDNPTSEQDKLLANLQAESQASKDRRTVIIDGITIQEGHANDVDPSVAEKITSVVTEQDGRNRATQLTYFRGGGILVEGNWDNQFLTQTSTPEVLGVAKRDIPLLLTNCLFQNNQAGNGGAVYSNGSLTVSGCRFTQNLSRGPDSSADQNFIPWTAGGSIATNYTCDVWNTLFDNNEAQRGAASITLTDVHDADARQGSGGVISASETSVIRVHNSNLVMNKARQFPAIYNFLDNGSRASDATARNRFQGQIQGRGDGLGAAQITAEAFFGPGSHYAINTIFWGNTATESDVHSAVDSEVNSDKAELRKTDHVANFGRHLEQNMLWFCAYEDGKAVKAMLPMPEITDGMSDEALSAAQEAALAKREAAKKTAIADDYRVMLGNGTAFLDFVKQHFGTYTNDEGTELAYNHNQLINSRNDASDGPYFTLPSMVSGVDGYMENADWLVTRLNALVDNGWSYLQQEVDKEDLSSSLLTARLYVTDADGSNRRTQDDAYNATVYPGKMGGAGFYNVRSRSFYERFCKMGFGDLLPIGDKPYMKYIREGEASQRNMRRISTHPKSGVNDVLIDIGIYEYQYVQLTSGGDEIDVVWVATTEDQSVDSDGSTWKKATSNLQGAIDMLLLSRNNHDKVLKIRGGDYSPNTLTSNNKQAFFISVNDYTKGNVTMPKERDVSDQYGVKSLTIRGGYSNNATADDSDGEDQRDIEANRVTLVMARNSTNTADQLDHLFLIEDAEQKLSSGTFMSDAKDEYSDYVIPLVFDGLTFVNQYAENQDRQGGAALLYQQQTKTGSGGGTKTDSWLKPGANLDKAGHAVTGSEAEEFHKLIIKDCVFKTNGVAGSDVPAVRIERGGGQALVVNSLFHDNNGAPLDAMNTQVVNCTFARNGGHLTLRKQSIRYDDGTEREFQIGLYNSLIWKDNYNSVSGDYDKTQPQYEAYHYQAVGDNITESPVAMPMAYNAVSGLDDAAATDANISLDDDNRRIYVGPNFTDPDHGDFHVKPSARIINQGNQQKYVDLVPYYPTYPAYLSNSPASSDESIRHQYAYQKNVGTDEAPVYVWFQSAQRGRREQLTGELLREGESKYAQKYTEQEVAGAARVKGDGLDRGAFESTAAIERVVYVMDGADGTQDGTSWENAYPIDKLQDAIDAASIYSFLSPESARERAFVFVKGTSGVLNDGNTVKLREGVTLYGGIGSKFMAEAVKDKARDGETELTKYTDASLNTYVRTMKAARDGVATKGASTSTIAGLEPDNDLDYNLGFHVDGFWISGGERATSPVHIDRDNVVISNCVVTGNQLTGAEPVLNMQSGLLYNSLLFGNTAGGPVVSLGDDATKNGHAQNGGYMLNCTVVTDGTEGVAGAASHQSGNVVQPKSYTQFAPYMNTANAYTLPDYLTNWEPYRYQLTETAADINSSADNGTDPQGGIDIARKFQLAGKYQQDSGSPAYFVYFDSDLDVLGNPRRLGGRVDNGCFETWRVEGNKFATTATDADFSNYGGHLYPHRGSVVYIMEGANFVVRPNSFSEDDKLVPGYLLLKKGASLYGQGNHVSADYLAVEKAYDAGSQYHLTALPYPVRHATETLTAMTYDGERRSTWNRDFQADNSDCWTSTALGDIRANEGWLMDRGGSAAATTVRFTGWRAADETDAAYSENGDSKVVTLVQHNSNETTLNDYPNFTKAEDMGWNLVGMPWLVASYETSPLADDTRQMNVPHVFYQMNGDGTYVSGATILTQQSWADGSALRLGEGFFTQTAVIGSEEQLTFKVPMFGGTTASPARQRISIGPQTTATRSETATTTAHDVVDVRPQAEAGPAMDFRLGSDGVKWFAFDPQLAQIYVRNAAGTCLSLVSEAPVETDIDLGVVLPTAGSYEIALPEPEAYGDYAAVWVVDQLTGRRANLLDSPFVLTVQEGGTIDNRLKLRFGAWADQPELPALGQRPSVLKVTARYGRLPLRGIGDDEQIRVYTAGGVLVYSGTAAESTSAQLPDGIYVVRR